MDGESTINPNVSTSYDKLAASQAKLTASIDASASAFTPSKNFSNGWDEDVPTGGFGGFGTSQKAFTFEGNPTEPKPVFVAGNNSNNTAPTAQKVSHPTQENRVCRLCEEQPAFSSKGVCSSCFAEMAQCFPQKQPPAVAKPTQAAPVRKCVQCGTTQGFIHKKGTCTPCFKQLRDVQAGYDALSNTRVVPNAEKASQTVVPHNIYAGSGSVRDLAQNAKELLEKRKALYEARNQVSEKVSYKINIRTGDIEMHNDAKGPKEWVAERNNTLPQRGMQSFAAGIRELEQSDSTQYLGWK